VADLIGLQRATRSTWPMRLDQALDMGRKAGFTAICGPATIPAPKVMPPEAP